MNGYPLEFSVFYYLLMILNKNSNNNPENLMILLDCYNDKYNGSFVIDDSNASKYINGDRKIPSPPYDQLVKYKTQELTSIIKKLNISNITAIAQTFYNLLDDPIMSIDPVYKKDLQNNISNTNDPFEKIALIYKHALILGNNKFKLRKHDKEDLKNAWERIYKNIESSNSMPAIGEEGYLFYEMQKKAYQDIYYNIKNYYPEEYVVLLLTALFSKAHSDDLFNSDDLLEYLRIIQPTIRGISKDPEQLSLDILYDKEFIDSRLFLLVCHDALTMTIIDGKRRYYRLQSHQLASLPQRQLDIYNYLNEFCKSIYYPEGLPSEKP